MLENKPFIHKFNTQGNQYIYDVNTNNIIKTEQIAYDIIDDYGAILFSDIVHRWGKKYDEKLITEVLNNIHKEQTHGIFSPERPSLMDVPMCEEHFCKAFHKLDHLILNITERCNLRCKYCTYSGTYFYERKHSLRNMHWEVAKKAVDYFCLHADFLNQKKEKITISFFGGEPLLNFGFIKRIKQYLSKHFNTIDFHIDTNGTTLNEEIMKFLIENDTMLQVSIDGPLEEHDKYRVLKNGNGSFNLIVKNLQKLQKMNRSYYKRRVSFVITLTPSYKLLEISKFFSSNELVKENSLSINYVSPYDTNFIQKNSQFLSRFDGDLKQLKKQYIDLRINGRPMHKFLSGLFDKALIPIHRRQQKLLGKNCNPNGICVPGVRRLFVDTDGRFYPCERVGGAFCIGDVDKGTEIKKVRSMIKKYIDGSADCLNCWAVRLCDSCFTSARKGHEFDFERKKQICFKERSVLHDNLIFYAEIMEKNPKAFDFIKDMVFG